MKKIKVKDSAIDRKLRANRNARATKPITVSVATIAKNEGRFIGRLIETALPFADQFVIGIDESTTDNTRQVCEEWAKKVPHIPFIIYEYKWEKHFSNARNIGVEKCTGDWIQCLDAHEYFNERTARNFKETLRRLPPHVKLVSHMLYNGIDEHGVPRTFFYSPKLFRNGFGIKWEGSIHNAIRCVPTSEALASQDITVIHERDIEAEQARAAQRKEMNIAGLANDATQRPDDARPKFYTAQTMLEQNRYDEAFAQYEEYLKVSTFDAERYQALFTMADIAMNVIKSPDKAIEFCKRAEAEILDRVEHTFTMAIAYLEKFNTAKENYDRAVSLRYAEVYARRAAALTVSSLESFNYEVPVNPLFMHGDLYTWRPWWLLAHILDLKGNKREAVNCVNRALMFRPSDQNLIKARAALGQIVYKSDKPRVTIFDSMAQFTGDMMKALGDKFEFRRHIDCLPSLANASDIVFLEWADHNAVIYTNAPIAGKPVVLRIHRHEVYGRDIKQINWGAVDHIIFETEHIKRSFERIVKLPAHCSPKIHIIPNGVDLNRFTLTPRGDGSNVAVCNYLTFKKDPMMMLEIARMFPQKTFHVAGEWQNADLEESCMDYIRHYSIENVKFYGWVSDTARWLDDVKADYFLNTAIHEGMPYAVLEAMAKGIKPIIRRWPGADEQFNAEWLFGSAMSAGQLFKPYADATDCRQFLIDRKYTLADQMAATQAVLESCIRK